MTMNHDLQTPNKAVALGRLEASDFDFQRFEQGSRFFESF